MDPGVPRLGEAIRQTGWLPGTFFRSLKGSSKASEINAAPMPRPASLRVCVKSSGISAECSLKPGPFYLVLIICLALSACNLIEPGPNLVENSSFAPVNHDDGWRISSPAEQGLDPRLVARAFTEAQEMDQIRSLLIVKNGYLVAEEYFNGQQWDRTNNVASVTKSYLSALVGIALEQGYITSLDQKMMDFFPEYATPGLDRDKFDITIRQLLQMTAGYPFDNTDAYYSQLMKSGNYLQFIIENHPLANPPGEEWNYSSASAHLLAGILTKAVGTPLVRYATQNLFDPLDMDIRTWERDPQGYYMGGSQMAYISRDMAKFGVLYLDKGTYGGQQVIPSHWIEESLQAYSSTSYRNLGYFKKINYGYLWWSAKIGKHNVNYAWGHGGQFIVLVPELDMVVVTTANPYLSRFNDEAWQSEKSIMDLIGRIVARAR